MYVQALAASRPANQQQQQQTPAAAELLSKARKELSQQEINLTTADAAKGIQEMIQSIPHRTIIKALQETIDNANLEGKPQLEDVTKLRRGTIRMRATTREGAKAIKEANIDWNKAYAGLKVYKPKYGIVIHGVPVWELNLDPGYEETDEYKDTIDEWQGENANRNNITIANIKPLSRKPRTDHIRKKHQSIIVFTEDAEAADRYIARGFLIDSQSFQAEKYAPHLRITQCYKCQEFRHTASKCNKKVRCGRCSPNHLTTECTSDECKCANCGGHHEAWPLKCPTRRNAGEQAQEEREKESAFFRE